MTGWLYGSKAREIRTRDTDWRINSMEDIQGIGTNKTAHGVSMEEGGESFKEMNRREA